MKVCEIGRARNKYAKKSMYVEFWSPEKHFGSIETNKVTILY
jgi:hypothetical protein